MEGMLCRKRVWLQFHKRSLASAPSEAQQRTMGEGTRVGMLAREIMFPTGTLIEQIGDAAVAETASALANDPPAIFEATFVHNGVLVMCDLLANNFDGTWNLIEVKASTGLKEAYLHDTAIQCYVVQQAGIELRRVELLQINKAEVKPDRSNLFRKRDITDQVLEYLTELPDRVAQLHALLAQDVEPDVAIGNHCQKPYPCPFRTHCWQHVPEPSIFSIPRLQEKQKNELVSRGILDLADMPHDYPLTAKQQKAVHLMIAKKEEINVPAIEKMMYSLAYPIYFLDFETDAQAIPPFDGLKPYEAVPFQYSCHILYQDGSLAHSEYLHTDQSDPRPRLLAKMLRDLGSFGSVVAYNASFERSVLRKLAQFAPRQSNAIQSIIDRLWDQLDVFKSHYQSYRFRGSNSIKNVLPVVAPHLNYAHMPICRGDQAQAIWATMIQLTPSPAKEKMISDLLDYCRMDTLAMVEIHRHLQQLCSKQYHRYLSTPAVPRGNDDSAANEDDAMKLPNREQFVHLVE